jgi:hypothetical protein
MLRIVTEQDGDLYTLFLHGRLAGDWVPLLERYWNSITESEASAHITAVLSNVSFIDREGEGLIERMLRRGVDFVTSGCMNRHLLERIRQRSARGVDGQPSPGSTLRRGQQ